MKKLLLSFAALSLLALPIALAPARVSAESLVEICHRPPGDPAAEETLLVGPNAATAHLKNHPDTLGACGGCHECD